MGIVPAELPDERSFLRQWFKVLTAKRQRQLVVGLLADTIVGVWTHFDREINRTVPCVGESECSHCRNGNHRRWKGYIPCITSTTREPRIVEVTEGAARAIMQNPLALKGLRGCVLKLKRKSASPTSPLLAELEPPTPGQVIPEAFDVIPSLERLWSQFVNTADSDNPPSSSNKERKDS